MIVKEYKVSKHNSTVCGYPGKRFDWANFDWNRETFNTNLISKGISTNRQAPPVFVDAGLIGESNEYLHVPYDWAEVGAIYRVRPNESMRAGEVYRGRLVESVKAIKKEDGWYWRLIFSTTKTEK